MATDYKSLLDMLKPKQEEPIMSQMTPTPDQLMTPANPTPEQLASIMEQRQIPEPEVKAPAQPVVKQAAPKKEDVSSTEDKNLPPSPEAPMSKSEALIAEYNKLLGKGEQDLAEARKRDRMLKIGGSLGDALATYLNAQGQMNVKAPGVQVQQGAGLGKIADMFATSPEIASDVATRREAMMKQYAELAKGERAEKRLTSEEKRADIADKRARELAKMQIEGSLKEAGIRASRKGELTPYQQYMMDKSEKKEGKLSDKQTKEVEGLDNVLSSLNEVELAKEGVNTGRYASSYQSGKDIIPGLEADQNFVALRQMSGTQLFDYVKEQSGVSYSVKELQELKNNMPTVDDDDNTFKTKLTTIRKIIERKRQNKLKALEGQGKDVSGFKQEQPETKTHPITGKPLKKVPGGWEEVD
jgi:hypothetical protein